MHFTFQILKRTIGILGLSLFVAVAATGQSEQILESPRDIPVACEVDVVVVGGSSGAVSLY